MFSRPDNGRVGHVFRWLLGVLLGLGSGLSAVAALTPGSLVVERMGDGSAPLTSSATPVFLDVFNPDGTSAAPSIALLNAAPRPTSAPFNLMESGSATSDGFLTRSVNELCLQMPGYNGIPGEASIVNSANTRTIGVVNGVGAVDTSRSLAMFNGNNFRSIVSVDGTAFWAAGTSSSPAQGVVYVNGSSVSVLSTANARCVNIFNDQLYYSTGSGTVGIYSLGSGLPTSGSPAAGLVIAVGGSSPNPYAFQINPVLGVAYVADGRTIANGGGIIKYTNNGGAWSSAYTLGTTTGMVTTYGARGLTVDWTGANPIIYATTTEDSANRVIRIVDTGSGAGATLVATAQVNTVFRGLDFAPLVGAAGAITQGNPAGVAVSANASGVTYTITDATGATGYNWTVPAGASITAGWGTTNLTVTWGSTGGDVSVTPTNYFGSGTSSSLTVTVVDATPPLLTCATNKSVEYTDTWTFDAPSGTNTITVLSTTTNWTCGAGYVATRVWQATDAIGDSATCTQMVTVVDTTPPTIMCPSNLTVACSSPWSFGTAVAADRGLGGALVYDNSVNDRVTRFDSGTNEVGNEIILAGEERYLQGFSYEFWSTNLTGSWSFQGTNVTVRLRFYANDGTNFNGYPTPGTVLYDSGEFWLGMGTTPRATVAYDEFDLWLYALYPLVDAVPSNFTWTVQFSGLGTNDLAGVDLYSPPVIGQSYGDFWLRTDTGWQLRTNPAVEMDIAARAMASTNHVAISVLSTVTNAMCGNAFVATRTWRATDACGNFSDCSQTVTAVDTSAYTNISISEFMAKNVVGITNEYGEHSDWIEIHNAGPCPVDLNGWALTDDFTQPAKWLFPPTNIASGQFLVVWASDRNKRIPGAPLHTNFKLSDGGEYLALVQPDGTVATQFYPTFPPQLPDVSYGLPADSVAITYLAWPTPGATNSPGTNFIVGDLQFQPGRGWYTNSVAVSIGPPTAGVTYYYTTDGTVPGPTNGFVYTSVPLLFTNTTVLRAAAYRPGYVPAMATHTYVFPDQVAYQTGAGFPTNWGVHFWGQPHPEVQPVPAVYGLNSNIVNDLQWSNQIPAALLSLPTVSLAMNTDDMFGTNGIYSNPVEDTDDWERSCSVEYFRPDTQPGFQINCGIQIHGGASRYPYWTSKHSLRLLFKQMYGGGMLLFDLYPGSPVREFATLVLHASFNDHWNDLWDEGDLDGRRAQMQRDQWCADTQRETGGYGTHGTYVNLYINGLYWGLYNLGERPDASYAAHYLGGQKQDYDAIKGDELKDGTTNAWNQMFALAEAGVTDEIAYSNMCYYLDVPSFIDYLLINFYAANLDFYQNWWCEGSVTHGVPFHFFSWDAEFTFLSVTNDLPVFYESWSVSALYLSLHEYPEFRRLFGDHAQRLLYNQGALTPERCAARWMQRAREIDLAIIAESARWGVTNSTTGGPITHTDWLQEQNFLLTNWFPQRTDILIEQLRTAGLYPEVAAPVFTPHGGIIATSLPVTITIPMGTILYYTTNGTDPRLPDGGVSTTALVFDQGPTLTLTLTNSVQLRARCVTNALTWSALVEADYLLAPRVSSIAYRADGGVELDFVVWPGLSYTLQACSELNSPKWEAIAAVVPFPDGTASFVDTAATNYPARFYRLTWP